MTTSPKLDGSSIVSCPEVEQAEPCKFFGAGICPGCYSEKLYRVRRATWTGAGKTPERGLIRLGTYIEITEGHWTRFKMLFPKRHYFLITRGLEPESLYRALEADPLCLNVQVSVDVLMSDGKADVVPDVDRLRWFARAVPKSLFRFKTLDRSARDVGLSGLTFGRNVEGFEHLVSSGVVPIARVLETPLRLPGVPHLAHQETPLEAAGWNTKDYFRCNSPCVSCRAENGVLACAATPSIVARVQSLQPAQPRRASVAEVEAVAAAGRIAWGDVVRAAILELGRPALTREVYREVERAHPEVVALLYWKTRVRQAINRAARRSRDGRWELVEGQPVPDSDLWWGAMQRAEVK